MPKWINRLVCCRKKFQIVCYFAEELFDDKDSIPKLFSFLSDWLLRSKWTGNLSTPQMASMQFRPQKMAPKFGSLAGYKNVADISQVCRQLYIVFNLLLWLLFRWYLHSINNQISRCLHLLCPPAIPPRHPCCLPGHSTWLIRCRHSRSCLLQ